jgi:RNA-binding motif protein, X-linked 2
MNVTREIERLNAEELRLTSYGGRGGDSFSTQGAAQTGSWHEEYKGSAYIFAGNLDFRLTEGDILSIFSQYGTIVDFHFPRDDKSGSLRGFGFMQYEDERSTVLVVDNLNGIDVLGRTVRVDHVKKYRKPKEVLESKVGGVEGLGEVVEEEERRKKAVLFGIEDPFKRGRKEKGEKRERRKEEKEKKGHQHIDEQRKHHHRKDHRRRDDVDPRDKKRRTMDV